MKVQHYITAITVIIIVVISITVIQYFQQGILKKKINFEKLNLCQKLYQEVKKLKNLVILSETEKSKISLYIIYRIDTNDNYRKNLKKVLNSLNNIFNSKLKKYVNTYIVEYLEVTNETLMKYYAYFRCSKSLIKSLLMYIEHSAINLTALGSCINSTIHKVNETILESKQFVSKLLDLYIIDREYLNKYPLVLLCIESYKYCTIIQNMNLSVVIENALHEKLMYIS